MSSGRRSSTRIAEKNSSPQSAEKKAGTKRKAEDNASPKASKSKRPSKEQKTLEETIAPSDNVGDGIEDEKMKDAEAEQETNGDDKAEASKEQSETNGQSKAEPSEETKAAAEDLPDDKSAFDQVKADEADSGKTSKPDESKAEASGKTEGTAVEEDKSREKAQPSNILEKGIIYFFTRGRVGMEDPSSVQELQRSYFVLRPLPAGAKITDGAIQDVGNNRLIALPKKVWPKSGKDRFMVFVEKAQQSMKDLQENFFQGSTYSTQTTGTRHTPEVTPIGEGVYAMTSTGDGRSTTHLAYMLTIPREVGDVQNDVGIAEKGSFILSSKNPESSAPSYAQLPSTPNFPKELIEEFGSRGWMPTKPEHLDYENASLLLIGENFESGGALEPTAQDKKQDDKEIPEEELIKLEDEDEERIKNLKGDKTIFEDLGISSKEYPDVKSTW